MRFSNLKLINFKSYKNQIFDFPPPRGKKNLVLIGGLNGYGKTSILEAIYLCLYGAESIQYLGRAGLTLDKKASYATFLNRAFYGNADYNDPMSVSTEIVDEDYYGYKITRTWYFDKNRKWQDEDVNIFKVQDGIPKKPVDKDELGDILEQNFVVANLAPFFFFDGEEVKSLANKDKVEQVKTAIDTFLGIVILRSLQKRLRDFQNNRRRGISQVDLNHLQSLSNSISENEQLLSDLEEQKSTIDERLSELNVQLDNLNDRMCTIGYNDGNISSLKELAYKIKEYQNLLDKSQSDLNDMVSKKLAINLISDRTIFTFLNQIKKEIASRKWENECSNLKPQRERFISNFFSINDYTPPLTDKLKEQLRKSICRAWEALFFPPPDGCATTIIHDYLDDDSIHKINRIYQDSAIGRKDLINKLEEIRSHEKHLSIWNTQMAKAEGLDKSGALIQRLKSEMSLITHERDECIKQNSELSTQIKIINAELGEARSTYEREHKRHLDNEPINSLVHKAEKIYNFIDNKLIPQLYPLKMRQLEEEITNVFSNLSHKHHVRRITIDDDASVHLYGKDSLELDFDKSAGEAQLFATSLLAALANISGAQAPLVVDTPLGRLDSIHRHKILEFWTTNQDRQVILLSQDKEIGSTEFQNLKPYILKSYILNHKDMGMGIGQTSASEGYFGDENDE